MQTIIRLVQTPRSEFIFLLLASLGLFGGSVVLGHTLRLDACPLCILQRMLCLALGLSATLGLLGFRYRTVRILAAFLMLASTTCGTFVAGYQTYIQRFANDVQCSGEAAWWELLVDWAGEHAPLFFQANGLCSESAWKFLGLSIAELSLIAFTALTLIAIYALFLNMVKQRQ